MKMKNNATLLALIVAPGSGQFTGIVFRPRPDDPWGDPEPRHVPRKYAAPAGAGSPEPTVSPTVNAAVSAANAAAARSLFREVTCDIECVKVTGLLGSTGAAARIGTARPKS